MDSTSETQEPSDQRDQDDAVRDSFRQQTDLFEGDDSIFAIAATRPSPTAWIDPLTPEMLVLDVACGAAHAAELAAPHVRQVVGVDLTPELLVIGAARLREGGITNVLLQEGNAAALPFVDASFDLVMCRTALHHMGDPIASIAEMARVCKPGGRVVVSDLVAPDADVREVFDDFQRTLDPSHARTFVVEELAAAVGAAVGTVDAVDAPGPFPIPVHTIFSDVSDRARVLAVLEAELAGGAATGMHPVRDGDAILVEFRSATVRATRA
jgi:ubiquinone/menaquinone biosynthesis C-methylase UbiE